MIKTQQGHLSEICDIESFRDKIGCVDKDKVLNVLGAPTFTLPYDQNTWYYGSASVETDGFLKPEVVCTITHVLSFNEKGVLTHFSKRAGPLKITVSDQTTPLPSCHRNGLLERVFHNLGKVSPASAAKNK